MRRGGPLEGRGMAVDGCTDDRRRPVVNDRITLHGDNADARARAVCVPTAAFPVVIH